MILMTKEIFCNYLSKLNSKFTAEKRRAIIFLDNFSGQKIEDFSNIKLHFVSPNRASLIQQMDQGIIKFITEKSFLNSII